MEGVMGDMASLLLICESYESERESSGVSGDDEKLLEAGQGRRSLWLEECWYERGRCRGALWYVATALSSLRSETLRPVASIACIVR